MRPLVIRECDVVSQIAADRKISNPPDRQELENLIAQEEREL
ncbi:MAG: hypothetical protein ACYDHE_14535 [Candidatus Acidiferrales bacterium]